MFDLPNNKSLSSLRASRLSLRNCRSISAFIRFCSCCSSDKQQAIFTYWVFFNSWMNTNLFVKLSQRFNKKSQNLWKNQGLGILLLMMDGAKGFDRDCSRSSVVVLVFRCIKLELSRIAQFSRQIFWQFFMFPFQVAIASVYSSDESLIFCIELFHFFPHTNHAILTLVLPSKQWLCHISRCSRNKSL